MTSRTASLAQGAFLAGHAQQGLQLVGAASGQDLLGRFQPAQHDHRQGWGRWILGVARLQDRTASARTSAGPPSSTDSNLAASSAGSRRVNLMSWPRG